MLQGHGIGDGVIRHFVNPLLERAYLKGLRRGLETAENVKALLVAQPPQSSAADRWLDELREEILWAEVRAGLRHKEEVEQQDAGHGAP